MVVAGITITEAMLKEAVFWAVVAGWPAAVWLAITYAAITTPLPERGRKRKT